MCKVKQMYSYSGKAIANQFLITTKDKVCFQSYDSIIAIKYFDDRRIVLDINTWDYSQTTGKYRNIFLRELKPETQMKIDSGIYRLKNLNK